MIKRHSAFHIGKKIFSIALSISIVSCYPAQVLAQTQTAWTAERDEIIRIVAQQYLQGHMDEYTITSTPSVNIGYLQAEAYYLYAQGYYEDAIAVWKDILSLDGENETALFYIEEATKKIDSINKPKKQIVEETRGLRSMRQKKLGPVQSQYSHTKLSTKDIKPEYELLENRHFDSAISLVRNEQEYAIRTDRDSTALTQNIRADTSFGDYASTLVASWNYDHVNRDDFRFLRYVNFLLEHNNFRFMMGDNSTYLSRYVFNGTNYRGLDFMAHTEETIFPIARLKAFYGQAKSFDSQSEQYFYPIEMFGLRNELEFNPSYKFGLNFGYQFHDDKITRVDSLFRPRRNIVYSLDQYIKAAPWWVLRHEIAYSETDNEVRNDILDGQDILDREDWGHYITSNILRDKWHMFTVYEYGGPEFRSMSGEPKYFRNMMPNDREIFENTYVATPTDEFLFELQYYRIRTNLEDAASKETVKDNWFKGLVRIRPRNYWWPTIGIRGSLQRSRTTPGSSDITDKKYTRDVGIDLAKTLYGVDWTAGYLFQKSYDDLNYKFCDLYRHLYSIRGHTELIPDVLNLNAFYSFANLDILVPVGDMTSSAHENKIDTYLTSRLWDSSNVSLGYHYFNRRDHIGTYEDLDSHTGSVVFNWPYTREFFDNKKFTMAPYLSYYYTKKDEYADYGRSMFSGKLDASYYFNPDNKLSMALEYLEGWDNSDQNLEGDEVRFITTYRSTFGLPPKGLTPQ